LLPLAQTCWCGVEWNALSRLADAANAMVHFSNEHFIWEAGTLQASSGDDIQLKPPFVCKRRIISSWVSPPSPDLCKQGSGWNRSVFSQKKGILEMLWGQRQG